MNPAILIVGYQRPENIEEIYLRVQRYQIPIFIFIDRCDSDDNNLNSQTIAVAERLATNAGTSVRIAELNLGVGHALPAALDWALNNCDSIIVLEDDCFPNIHAIPYLIAQLPLVEDDSNIALVSGYSPADSGEINNSSLSSYPLIWGWATTRIKWRILSPYAKAEIGSIRILVDLLKPRRKLLSISFFLSAYLRSRNHITKAWDGNIALAMLLKGMDSIVPNENLITNVGNDLVASHTNTGSEEKEIVISSKAAPSYEINWSKKNMDEIVERRIYKLRFRHYLSPIKAVLQVIFHRERHV